MSSIMMDALQATPTHSSSTSVLVLVALVVCIGLGKVLARLVGFMIKALATLVITTTRVTAAVLFLLIGVFAGCAVIVTATMSMVAKT